MRGEGRGERKREGEEEREGEIILFFCLFTHWLIPACALTKDQTPNLGVLG